MSRGEEFVDQEIQCYRKDGLVFTVNTAQKLVTVPQSVDRKDYPDEITEVIKKKKYNIQLTIE
mgnify:CR=1 FL=1